jgi:hypothetical protein
MTSVEVELEIFETVVRGGVRRVTWHVENEDDWISATVSPGAQVDRQDNSPGTVWRTRVLVRLPLGAKLMRVESEPDRQKSEDPLAYFWSAPRVHPRLVKRSYFQVADRGRLLRLPQPPVTKNPRA